MALVKEWSEFGGGTATKEFRSRAGDWAQFWTPEGDMDICSQEAAWWVDEWKKIAKKKHQR